MRVLGIDPGTRVMGYGVVEERGDSVVAVEYGALTSQGHTPIAERLATIYRDLGDIILQYRPDEVAVEQPFVAKNARSALAIGRAQAVALVAAAMQHTPASEYTPAEIKQSVASYGASSKEQVQEMVRLQLGLADTPQPKDAADALAVALCHLSQMHLSNLLAKQQ